jgi:FKBP-type peptidyl-prolyl cis-trans isomerase
MARGNTCQWADDSSCPDPQLEQPSPEYEFDQAQYLNRLQHNKQRTREEMLAFFEENATQDGVISMPSGLQYKVFRQGSGRSPEVTDTVVIDYRVFLPDGTEIYNTYDEPEPVTFHMKSVKSGLEQALPKMEEGSCGSCIFQCVAAMRSIGTGIDW